MFLVQAADASVVRELVKNQVHVYRVHLDVSTSDYDGKVDYVLRAKTLEESKESSSVKVELQFKDYRFEALSKVLRNKLMGAGTVTLSGLGLPSQLKSEIQNPHIWYPLLAWYVPEEVKEGKFDAVQDLGWESRLDCKGTLKDGVYSMTGNIAGPGTASSPVALTWKLGKDGWLTSGSGEVTDQTGTIHFSISKR
ncbi:MAG TPA: hypothetical protein VG944_10205 [Fimbriimonas sp.]|nr:hypothetical protein [Fimbriimonas sp.]